MCVRRELYWAPKKKRVSIFKNSTSFYKNIKIIPQIIDFQISPYLCRKYFSNLLKSLEYISWMRSSLSELFETLHSIEIQAHSIELLNQHQLTGYKWSLCKFVYYRKGFKNDIDQPKYTQSIPNPDYIPKWVICCRRLLQTVQTNSSH